MIRQLLPEAGDLEGPEALEVFYAQPDRRHLRADFVVSLDGAVEIGGRSKPLSAPADRDAFLAMRAVADAIMVGAGTARIERYGPPSLEPAQRDRRAARGQDPLPSLVVVTRQGGLSPEDKVFSGGYRPMVVTTELGVRNSPMLGRIADVIECGEEEVDLLAALDHLAELGLRKVVCEGGPTLLHALLTRELVDELCVTTSPVMAGPQHLHLSGATPLVEPARFRLSGLLEGDGLLLGRYESVSRR